MAITNYRLIEGDSVASLESQAQALIADGYKPHGGVAVNECTGRYVQAMVLSEPDPESPSEEESQQ